MADGKLEVDLALFQTVQDFVNWKSAVSCCRSSRTASTRSCRTCAIRTAPTCRSAATPILYAHNTNLVRAEDAPKSALDFLKPAFHDKLISVYPHDDDAALYLFHLIVQKYGWS